MTDAWPEERGFTVFYRHCGVSWQDQRSCPCNGECPVCGKEIEPYDWENTTRLPSRKVRYDRRSIFHGLLERRQRAAASGLGFFFRTLSMPSSVKA